MERKVYIDNQPLEEALKLYLDSGELRVEAESIDIGDAFDRVTFEPVYAKRSSPHYHASAMDGIAVRCEDTFAATERKPITLREGEDFVYVNTGNPLPDSMDSVIMIEDVDDIGHGKIRIMAPSYPWQHVRPVGEDIVKGEMILPSKHRIRALDMGALISGGLTRIKVYPSVTVGVLPTGSEIRKYTESIEKGSLVDSNSKMFEGMILEYNGIPTLYDPVPDDWDLLKEAIQKGAKDNQILVINAGSSAGSKDYTVDLIRQLGEVIVHGIAIKPGKPTILGRIGQSWVIGIPGYPVSAYFAFESFVKPLMERLTAYQSKAESLEAILSQRVMSSLKHEERVRVTLGYVNGRCIATPLSRGAGNTMSLVKADGVLTIPRHLEGIEGGSQVTIRLLKNYDIIQERLLLIGSHDLILEVLADQLPIASGHVGSMGGLLALRKGECHLAPIHLLDPKTGEYNTSYVKKYFPQKEMLLITGIKRLQGLMVQAGNPKRIQGFEDLNKENIIFINRQKGSGTRQLLDYQLKTKEILSEQIQGYQREMNTHMALAAVVQSGGADVGLGTYSAAKAMDLDFIPVGYESYEFLLEASFIDDERVLELIKILKSELFANILTDIGGYELDKPGTIRKVGE
jgi:putative molybdopterin biosynthesis protein